MIQTDPDPNTHLAQSGPERVLGYYSDEDLVTMKRFKKNLEDNHSKLSDFDTHNSVLRDPDKKLGLNLMRVMGIFVVCLMVFSVLFSVSLVLKDPPSDSVLEASGAKVLQVNTNKGT